MNAVGERLASKSKWSNLLKSSYVKTIILAAIVLGSVVVFWAGVKIAFATEYPLLTVASGSMSPTLEIGELIVVQGISNASELRAASKPEGDIIVFRNPHDEGELIVHRAINKTMHDDLWYIRTAGDHNVATGGGPDPWSGPDTWNLMISEKLLIGRVIGHVPWVGYIPLFVRRPEGMVLLIVLILIIVFAEYIPFSSKKRETAKD